ncbi:hypothetical protein Sste5344_009213 [Sporothrix stenoceras]
MTGFIFVDGRQNDRSTQRRMRRHVMKGKNAGKTLQRASRLPPGKQLMRRKDESAKPALPFMPSYAFTTSTSTGASLTLSEQLTILQRLPPAATFHSPVAMTAYAWQVIDEYFNGTVERVYAPSFGIASDTAKPLWFQSIFADEAAYHCTLALMQASNEAVLGAATGCVLASSGVAYAHYVAESLRQLKRRLAGPKALANSTILLVLMFISQEQMRHESKNARVHIAGLRQMVALRGGLAEFETRGVDRPLLIKICKIDIVYALQFGTPPLFYRDVLSSVTAKLDIGGRCAQEATSTAETHHSSLSERQPDLYSMLVDVMAVALLFEDELPQRPIDIFTFGDIFSSLSYRLLKAGLDTFPGDKVDELYHLGMTMFSMALFLRFDQGRLLDYQPIGRRFKAVVEDEGVERSQDKSERSEDQKEDETCFWVMMLGGTWTRGDWSGSGVEVKAELGGDCPGRQQKARKVRQVADRLGLSSWEDARALLAK